MSVLYAPAVEYYYDSHPTEEDLMGQSPRQFALNSYLIDVLEWLFHGQDHYVVGDINLYMTDDRMEHPLVPDIAVFRSMMVEEVLQAGVRSFRIKPPQQMPPVVVFEIASDDTWRKDLYEKPAGYARMGVEEYFLHDPQKPPKIRGRLKGWRNSNGQTVELTPDERGWLWSESLQSWLATDDWYLRIHDATGRMRRTEAEAHQAEAEALQAEAETLQAEADKERELKERAYVMLRELGVNTDGL